MKVLMLNGSPRPRGCTYTALTEVGKTLEAEGVEVELVNIGNAPLRDCIACGKCSETHRCIFTDDQVNEFIDKCAYADGFVFGSPVYYAHADGRLLSFLDRVFYASTLDTFAFKPAAAVVSARRGGTTAALDDIQKYFGMTNMLTVGSTYWNQVHGHTPDEVRLDLEGIQTMHNLGHNMAWLLKSIRAGREAGLPAPTTERGCVTNFHH